MDDTEPNGEYSQLFWHIFPKDVFVWTYRELYFTDNIEQHYYQKIFINSFLWVRYCCRCIEFSLNKFNRVHNPIDAKINKTEERERAGILSCYYQPWGRILMNRLYFLGIYGHPLHMEWHEWALSLQRARANHAKECCSLWQLGTQGTSQHLRILSGKTSKLEVN